MELAHIIIILLFVIVFAMLVQSVMDIFPIRYKDKDDDEI